MPVIAHHVKELGAVDGISVLNSPAGAIVCRSEVWGILKQVAEYKRHVHIHGSVSIQKGQTNGGDLRGNDRGAAECGMISNHVEVEYPAKTGAGLSHESAGKRSKRVKTVNGGQIGAAMAVAAVAMR